jgi:hypothetical protein
MSKKTRDKLTPLSFNAVDDQVAPLKVDADEALFSPADPATDVSSPPQAAPEAVAERAEPVQTLPPEPAKPATPTASATSATRASSDLPGWARSAYWIAVPASVLWAGAMAAFASGFQNPFGPFEYRPFPIVAFGALCLLPAVFILLAAYAVRQAAKLSVETRRARDLADEIAVPAALAADQVGGVAEAVRREVERAAAAAGAAEQQLLSLRRSLAEESDRLIDATGEAERRAQALTEGLARERAEMAGLTETLDAQVQAVTGAIAAQSRLVADASDLAATQIQEAEATLAARATDLAAAAGEASEAARIAADVLAEQVEKLELAGDAVSSRVEGVQAAFSDEHMRLAALAESLRADQEHIAARIEAQRIQLLDAGGDARASAQELAEAASHGAQSLRELIATVAEQVGELAAIAEADRTAMNVQAQSDLKLFTGVVAEERAALEAETRAAIEALAAAAADTRKAAIEQTDAARDRVQQLGETAFALGQQTDRAFEARISSAKAMIEQSASLVEEAGQRSAERIEAGLAASHGALGDLHTLLGEIDLKVAALPEEARARAETVRQAVQQGIGELTAAARKAAEDTQAIDAAFQGRIKQNYEMLSEALRLMGRVAGAADAAGGGAPNLKPAAAKRPATEPTVNAALPETERSIRMPPETLKPAPAPPRADGLSAEGLGLRPRLKLTVEPPAPARRPSPPAAEAPREAVAADGAAAAGSEWTWKDLLSSIDEPLMDDDVLAERLIAEIEALGLDAPALLPLARIDELAAVMQAGDVAGARDVVRSLAPSAVRRLSRRVLTDKVLRSHADRYLQRYEDLLADSAKRDRDGFVTATLLGSDPGRAFLLFNAAVGELH